MEAILGLVLFIAFVGSLLLAYYSGKAEGSKETNKLADWEEEELATAREDVKNLKNAVEQLKARIHDEQSKTDIYVELLSKDDRRADKAVKAALAKAEAYVNEYAEEELAAAFSQSVFEGRFSGEPLPGKK